MSFFSCLRSLFYVGFMIVHLGAALGFDLQLLIDRSLYPPQLVELLDNYVKQYKDPFLSKTPPIWFRGMLYFEMAFQVPLLIIGIIGTLFGARWVRTPNLIYSSSVVTMMVPLITHLYHGTFKGYGPQTYDERVTLVGIYGLFFSGALLMLLDYACCRCSGPTTKVVVDKSAEKKAEEKRKEQEKKEKEKKEQEKKEKEKKEQEKKEKEKKEAAKEKKKN